MTATDFPSKWPDDMTLGLAREFLRAQWEDGVPCPCCTQHVKLYDRPLYSSIAVWLIRLVQRFRREPRFYSSNEPWSALISKGGDPAKLRYWGLIEQAPKDPEDTSKRTSGLWRPTAKGLRFADNALLVPARAFVFNGRVIRFSEETTSIRGALGKKFDYQELMDGHG